MPIKKKNKKHIWNKRFKEPIITNIESLCIYIRLYCVNIDSVQIIITYKDGNKIQSAIKVIENGYQIPFISKLKFWTDSLDTLAISELSIVGFSQSKKSHLVLGNLQLYRLKNVKNPVYFPLFFNELLEHNSFDIVAENSFSLNTWPFLYIPFSIYLEMNKILSNGEIIVSISDSTYDKSQLFYKFMYHSLKRYPYFEEYNIDTVSLFKLIDSWKSIPYSSMIDNFSQLISNIGDPHFRLVNQTNNSAPSQSNNRQSPVRFAILNNRVYVAAVQNKSLKNIQVGDELLSFNGVDAKSLLKYNSSNDNINRLIPISLRDSTQLELLRGSDTISAQLIYLTENEPLYTIPHRKYNFENGILYYKLNRWEATEYFHFQNLFLEKEWSKDIKCLILDLRNNGGGGEIAAAKIASSFITTPQSFLHHKYIFSNNEAIKESWVISPNPVLNLVNVPVIILTNRNTACASESFILLAFTYTSN
ncbi:MAG: S41 family peptidase [Firmicutes bacterium]|nr:S41 family peptidase [Bacillota bacterium]